MDARLLNFLPNLKCPITGSPLRVLNSNEIDSLNLSIRQGLVHNSEGSKVKDLVIEGFINKEENYVYPVVNENIACLLPASGISMEEVPMVAQTLSADGKNIVKDFYDQFGWKKSNEKAYNDTVTFEDRRAVSQEYWSRCHLRLNKYLKGGEYLLDVASGAIPNDEYLTYSKLYRARICMDFSILALKEASKRLNGMGIFILGDMTNIPIVDDCIDAVISLHTVYHVPQDEQTKAVAEAYRVLKTGRPAVIVYSWPKPPLMKAVFKIWKPLLKMYKSVGKGKLKILSNGGGKGDALPQLFVNQQGYDWFAKEIKNSFNARLEVYSSISRSFSQTFLREKMLGKQLSALIYTMENIMPSVMGRYGQFPVFLIQKKPQKHQFKQLKEANSSPGKRVKEAVN